MRRRYETISSPALGKEVELLAYGHFGAPIIAFPSGGGRFHDFEDNGMIDAISPLINDGKIKLYCTDGVDRESWLNEGTDPHWRGVRHNAFQDYLVKDLVPAIRVDCEDANARVALVGCSIGAYHAANFALKFPHLFHYALCMSGRYDLSKIVGSADSPEVYFNNPLAYVYNLHGNDLFHVRNNTHLALVCGQGAWEGKCLTETNQLADLLSEKGISHERDIWGFDVEHHWFWWRKQIAYHLGKTFS